MLSVDDEQVELEIDTKGRKSRRTVALSDVRRALVQVEFSRVADAELDEADDDSTDDGAEADDAAPDDAAPDDATGDDADETEI